VFVLRVIRHADSAGPSISAGFLGSRSSPLKVGTPFEAGGLLERSFAHCYETGGMRRTHLRGRENILKRQLIHVCAFNLSLIFRLTLGACTPREQRNRQAGLFRYSCGCRLRY
jgi:hypothetical protein